jgi:hypothetical protein
VQILKNGKHTTIYPRSCIIFRYYPLYVLIDVTIVVPPFPNKDGGPDTYSVLTYYTKCMNLFEWCTCDLY